MKIIIHWLILSAAVFAAPFFISGIQLNPIYVCIIVGACLTIINMTVKPIINIITLPINLITLGLFSLILNGLIFWFLSFFIKGFHVSSFAAAFWGALLVSIVNWIAVKIFKLD